MCALAAALGIRRIIVPFDPGLLSARGAASADVQRDYVRTVRLTDPSADQLRALFAPVMRLANSELQDERVPSKNRRFIRSLDVRYQGQSYEIGVPFGLGFAERFHTAHRRLYGYADRKRPIEVVNVRLLASGRGPRLSRAAFRTLPPCKPGVTRLHWAGRWLESSVHARAQLPVGRRIRGPAIITEPSATTVIPPGWCG